MMQPCEFPGCMEPGYGHHIVFKAQGGLNIPLNYKYLCSEHHNIGKESPHKSREIDLQYKKELQERYMRLFKDEKYTFAEICKKLRCRERMLEKAFKCVPAQGESYQREDIIRTLMGGKIYD